MAKTNHSKNEKKLTLTSNESNLSRMFVFQDSSKKKMTKKNTQCFQNSPIHYDFFFFFLFGFVVFFLQSITPLLIDELINAQYTILRPHLSATPQIRKKTQIFLLFYFGINCNNYPNKKNTVCLNWLHFERFC